MVFNSINVYTYIIYFNIIITILVNKGLSTIHSSNGWFVDVLQFTVEVEMLLQATCSGELFNKAEMY